MINPLTFFKGVTFKYVVGVAAVGLGVYFAYGKYTAESEVQTLENRIANREAQIEVLEQEAAQKDRAIDAANAARAELERLRFTYEQLDRDAVSVPEKDDGPVAPILQRTLDSLGSL